MPKFQLASSVQRMTVPVLALALPCLALAGDDPYAPPVSYYATATGVGPVLKNNLHNIIDGHVVRSYGDARFALQLLDEDPANSNNVVLIYTGATVDGTWDSGSTWNREHQWPRSQGIDSSGPDNSDHFNLRPSNPVVNSNRANLPFGTGGGYWDPQALALPGVNDRGDCSRACFYMAVRYDGSDGSTTNLELVNGFPGTNQMGNLAKMLEWHYSDPVNDIERRRNHLIYSSSDNPQYFQGNRNPFIDHPEFVWAIWGTSDNDTTLFVGGVPNADGSSTVSEVHRLIAGAAPAPEMVVTLDKIGSTPTTFDAVVQGDVLCAGCGTGQALQAGTQDRVIEVTVPSTATPVSYSGIVLIDNTDLTSAAAGEGADDEDDTIMFDVVALSHSNGSFSAFADQNSLTIDFGTLNNGSPVQEITFDIANLMNIPGLTADLDVLSISGSGDTAEMFTDVAPFAGQAPGTVAMFTATFDHGGILGSYEAVYTITVADEDIPGATMGDDLVLTLTGNVFEGECLAVGECADEDSNGIRDDGCVWVACNNGACAATDVVFADMGGQFGACEPDGTADGNDRFHALNCFAGITPDGEPGYACEDDSPTAFNVDAGGPFGDCAPDGVCDGNDAFAAINAFSGATSCSCPLDGSPAPVFDSLWVDRARLELVTTRSVVERGDYVDIDVLLTTPLDDLRGYQLHLNVIGGTSGHLRLVDIYVDDGHVFEPVSGSRKRSRGAAATSGHWSAFNTTTRQMLVGSDSPGRPVDAGYLATFVFQVSKDASGTFVVDLLHDDDPSHRTYLFPTPANGRIDVTSEPAIVRVRTSGR